VAVPYSSGIDYFHRNSIPGPLYCFHCRLMKVGASFFKYFISTANRSGLQDLKIKRFENASIPKISPESFTVNYMV
jgi:hypothetical protein